MAEKVDYKVLYPFTGHRGVTRSKEIEARVDALSEKKLRKILQDPDNDIDRRDLDFYHRSPKMTGTLKKQLADIVLSSFTDAELRKILKIGRRPLNVYRGGHTRRRRHRSRGRTSRV